MARLDGAAKPRGAVDGGAAEREGEEWERRCYVVSRSEISIGTMATDMCTRGPDSNAVDDDFGEECSVHEDALLDIGFEEEGIINFLLVFQKLLLTNVVKC
ncbi:hypothetical protein PIB30_073526 [Stylosanthes scabra]|uniref:Uncharacterized protein n=1 Tax=Stylosanthes scabra TaxID=79078 RepID=A0ABU6QP62_9FABA|nr:hypothetical protein [Stylosanthes scabra]